MGLSRLREALETGEWEPEAAEDASDVLNGLHDEPDNPFSTATTGIVEHEGEKGVMSDALDGQFESVIGEELPGMRAPILDAVDEQDGKGEGVGDDDAVDEQDGKGEGIGDDDVDELQRMLVKIQAIRDMNADMPDMERRRVAEKTVREIMRRL